jgi:hypothetical protein
MPSSANSMKAAKVAGVAHCEDYPLSQGILDCAPAAASAQAAEATRHRAFLTELDPRMRPPTLEPGQAVRQHSAAAAARQLSTEGRAAPGPLSGVAQQYAGVRDAILHGLDRAVEEEDEEAAAGAAAAWPPEQPTPKRVKREASPSGGPFC